jgi:hypothetical protein
MTNHVKSKTVFDTNSFKIGHPYEIIRVEDDGNDVSYYGILYYNTELEIKFRAALMGLSSSDNKRCDVFDLCISYDEINRYIIHDIIQH